MDFREFIKNSNQTEALLIKELELFPVVEVSHKVEVENEEVMTN